MTDWWQEYLGKPWVGVPAPPKSYTCGELVRYIHRHHLGIDTLDILGDQLVWRDCIDAMTPTRFGLRPLSPGEEPKAFDTVFMARAKYDDHVGIAAQTAEGLLVLHCLQGAGVVLESPGELRGRGFVRLSWYRHGEIS